MSFSIFTKKDIINGKSSTVQIENATKFLALYNCNVYWVIPKIAKTTQEIPHDTMFLLWKNADGEYGIMLPMVAGDVKAALCGSDNGVCVTFKGALKGEEPDSAVLLYTNLGADPYKLVKNAVAEIQKEMGSFRLRTDKRKPDYLNYLGWCTWDAFYGSVDEEKVIMGLESFVKAGVPLGYMILDDGSWDADHDYLNDVKIKSDKFPNGLKNLVTLSKEKYGLKKFGMWHCFEGYWGGIKPNGELAKRYTLIRNDANIRPWEQEERIQPLYLVAPEEIERFYEELHSYLAEQGVDMLKIDGQSAIDLFAGGKLGMAGTMKAYQKAMQNTAEKYFDGNVIHCMSNSNDVAYNMDKTNCWRNSYDYSPSDMKMQKEHIFINAMNAMWSSTFAVPDWDMFQTHSEGADMHAAARAISGGPVYVCDYPGKQNPDILKRLICSDGNLMCCDYPALPTEDSLFTDFTSELSVLKLFNRNGKIGVLGLFDCCTVGEANRVKFNPADVYGLEGEEFAVYFYNANKLVILKYEEEYEMQLPDNGFEIVTISPINHGFAAIGLADKYNTSAALTEMRCVEKEFCVTVPDGGRTLIYTQNIPAHVLSNGQEIDFTYDKKSGLLTVVTGNLGINEITVITE